MYVLSNGYFTWIYKKSSSRLFTEDKYDDSGINHPPYTVVTAGLLKTYAKIYQILSFVDTGCI